MQQHPACWMLWCEWEGTTLLFPLVWPRAAWDKEEAAGLEVWPSPSSTATNASSGNELETWSTNSNTLFLHQDCSPRKEVCPGAHLCRHHLQEQQSVAAMGDAMVLLQLGAAMPSTSLREAPHSYHCSRSSRSPWYHHTGLVDAEEQVCSQLG